jgi:glutamine cyclotransferase
MRSKRIGIIVIGLLALATSAVIVLKQFRPTTEVPPSAAVRDTQAVASVFEYEIVGEYPHDADAYTQGLIYVDGFLYESTGITGRSSLRKVRLETGEVIQQRAVNPRDFGEGLTEWRGRLVRNASMFLRDANGRRPVYGGTKKFQEDPHWKDYILFYEYFHGENGAGLGASHQTGWTGLVARELDLFARLHAEELLTASKGAIASRMTREQVAGH